MTRATDKPLACERSLWLVSEASGRRFARLTGLHHYPLATAVAMLFPRGTPPEEVRRVEQSTHFLATAGLPVPAIHDSDPERGWILQEDLGDCTLAAACAAGDARVGAAYTEALALLALLAGRPALPTSPDPPLNGRRLLAELEQFRSEALPSEANAGEQLHADLNALVQACLEVPVTLCHRDYHSRNLMLHEGRVRVLDHQDALPGPDCYDRVSLAYDPYVDIDDAVRDELAGTAPGTSAVAVQRLCKAIGTYARKGGAWQAFITPAARQARRLLARSELRLPVLEAALAPLALRR